MRYIVMDMEWNQPMFYGNSHFPREINELLFEVIQMGAVKLDESYQILDTKLFTIKPTYFHRIHPQIHKITGIKAHDLDDSACFADVLKQFEAWCGSDCVMLTWGCDDVSVIYHNISFFNLETNLSPFFDVQMLYAKFCNTDKNKVSLANAMTSLCIPQEDSKMFHNALNDAYYTALLFKALPNREGIIDCQILPKRLTRSLKRKNRLRNKKRYDTFEAALSSYDALHPSCPVCKEKTQLVHPYVFLTGNKYAGIAHCKKHSDIYVALNFIHDKDDSIWMSVIAQAADKDKKAYILTKQFQNTFLQDPLGALINSGFSSMPFED